MVDVNLEILLDKFELYTKLLNKKHREYEIILQRYNYYKKKVEKVQNISHFTECNLQGIITDESTFDFCNCYYLKNFPVKLCQEIIDQIGFDYIKHF